MNRLVKGLSLVLGGLSPHAPEQAKDLAASAFYGWRNMVSTFEDVGKDGHGFVDLLLCDMQMGDRSIALSSKSVDEHALLFERGYQFGRRTVLVDDVEDDDIRSKCWAYTVGGKVVAATALKSLAPSRCMGIPCLTARALIFSIVESG